MAIMVIIEWEGMTPENYDELRAAVGWLDQAPQGGRCHLVAFGDGGVRMTDVWDSAEDLQNFVDGKLMPEVRNLGLPDQARLTILPLHEMSVPGTDPILAT
ncbi:MAG TPA: hypothetical protein VHG90_01745 [Acidimicrobiales bacterium]|nr:hypothetical protein [Acidimicrobiales bacterium]